MGKYKLGKTPGNNNIGEVARRSQYRINELEEIVAENGASWLIQRKF